MFSISTIVARLRAIALCPCLPVGLHGLSAMLALLATSCIGRYMQSTSCSAYVQEISDMDAFELSLTAAIVTVVLSTGGAFAAAYRTTSYVAHRAVVLAFTLASLVFTLAANASLADSYASDHVCALRNRKQELDLEVRALCNVNCDALHASATMAVFVAMALFVSLVIGTYQHYAAQRIVVVESAGTPTTKFELMETPRMTDDENAMVVVAVPLDAPTKAV